MAAPHRDGSRVAAIDSARTTKADDPAPPARAPSPDEFDPRMLSYSSRESNSPNHQTWQKNELQPRDELQEVPTSQRVREQDSRFQPPTRPPRPNPGPELCKDGLRNPFRQSRKQRHFRQRPHRRSHPRELSAITTVLEQKFLEKETSLFSARLAGSLAVLEDPGSDHYAPVNTAYRVAGEDALYNVSWTHGNSVSLASVGGLHHRYT